jgi:putative oxidoreductase
MINTNPNTSIVPAIGRVLMAAIFIFSGFGKLMAPAATIGYIASTGLPLASLGYAIAVVTELGGGIALALGYQNRIVATVLALFSLATGLAFHNAIGDQNQLIHLMKNISMTGGFLQVAIFGAGAFSLDAKRLHHRASAFKGA